MPTHTAFRRSLLLRLFTGDQDWRGQDKAHNSANNDQRHQGHDRIIGDLSGMGHSSGLRKVAPDGSPGQNGDAAAHTGVKLDAMLLEPGQQRQLNTITFPEMLEQSIIETRALCSFIPFLPCIVTST